MNPYELTEMDDLLLEQAAGGMSYLLSEKELREILGADGYHGLPSVDEQIRIHNMLRSA